MKNYCIDFLKAFIGLFFIFSLNGCVKNTCHKTNTYSFYVPVYRTTSEVRTNIKNNASRAIQNPGKIYILGNYVFLNEIDKGIHIIDNSNPSSPKNISFIDIPGNMDLAVKGNTLYADLYSDLVAIDISNPLNIVVEKYIDAVFPYRNYGNGFSGDRSQIIVDWVKKDTTVTENCESGRWLFEDSQGILLSNVSGQDSKNFGSPIGQGGSMARFAIADTRLYTVSDADLNIFNITNPTDPIFVKKTMVDNWGIETIFPFKNKLFIGSQTGMYIYNIDNPDNPIQQGQFAHVRSCDPVIADDHYAYVTLRSGSTCQNFTNQLDILQLNNFTNPQLIKSYEFTNPHGLSKDGNLLFVCDGTDGLKVYDATYILNLTLIKQIPVLETYDVIATNNIALVVAKDGLYQYDYSNVNDIRFLSKVGILR